MEAKNQSESTSNTAKSKTSVYSPEIPISLFSPIFFHLFSWCVGQDPTGGPRTSNADVASASLLPPLLNHGSNTLQMNKHLHPFSVLSQKASPHSNPRKRTEVKRERKNRGVEGAQVKDDRWEGGSMYEPSAK